MLIEKSISNQNTAVFNLVFSHKPVSEVFKNPELLAAAKLARAEIKQQLIDSGRVKKVKIEDILDKMKYGSADMDTHGLGKDVQEILGSTSFHLMVKALKIDTGKFRFDDNVNTLGASTTKHRAKRATGVFQPAKIQTGQSASSHQKNSSGVKTKSPLIKEESSQSEDEFVFSTFPSGLDADTSLPDAAPEKNKPSNSSTSTGWRAAKPTTPRPQPSSAIQSTQPLPGSSSNVKKN